MTWPLFNLQMPVGSFQVPVAPFNHDFLSLFRTNKERIHYVGFAMCERAIDHNRPVLRAPDECRHERVTRKFLAQSSSIYCNFETIFRKLEVMNLFSFEGRGFVLGCEANHPWQYALWIRHPIEFFRSTYANSRITLPVIVIQGSLRTHKNKSPNRTKRSRHCRNQWKRRFSTGADECSFLLKHCCN